MLQIYIHGETEKGFLDLLPGTLLEMEALTDIFDEDLSTGEFSLPVEVPWTEKNRRLLNFSERVENFKTQQNFWVCDIYDRGFPELTQAKMTLLEKSGTLTYLKGQFSASISGTKGLFGSRIKNKNLKDLTLGGEIQWDIIESRVWATYQMKAQFPRYPYISFAPVAIENFIDTGNNYNEEFLAKDTVNYIIPLDGDEDSWEFGRPRSTDETQKTDPGEEEHIDFRTIPFFKLKYVLQQAFAEVGYMVHGDLLNSPDFDNLHIFNNCGIEFYSTAVYADYNRKIIPSDHVPNMSLKDFFQKVFAFFNVYPVFNGSNEVELKYRTRVFAERIVFDITKLCSPNFKSVYKEVTEDNGYTIDYGWDDKDGYHSDRIKDLTQKNLVATVNTLPNLATLDIGRPLTTDDMVLVEAENMYYIVANATVIPILWDAWSEKLDPFKVGNGDRAVNLGMGILCSYVEFDETDKLYIKRNRVGCRMAGSYYNDKFVKVKNDFGLSVFYISKQLIGGKNIPVSYNHHTGSANNVLERYTLALNGPAGLSKNFHEQWQTVLDGNEVITVTSECNKKVMQDLSKANTIQIQNVLFLPQKINSQLPLQNSIEMELLPL